MSRFFYIPVLLAVFFFAGACKKENGRGAASLYGTWVKGAGVQDTIWFMHKNGKDIMRIASLTPGMITYSEQEYRFVDGKLSIYFPSAIDFHNINSFTWIEPGSQFRIQGIELFLYMSSTITYFTYQRIN